MKKKIIIFIIVILVIIVTSIYLMQKKWEYAEWSEGYFSAETYLDGGTGEWEFEGNIKIKYYATINKGDVIIELTDQNNNEIYKEIISDTGESEVELHFEQPQICYLHQYTDNKDSDVRLHIYMAKEKSNFEKLVRTLDNMTGGMILREAERIN